MDNPNDLLESLRIVIGRMLEMNGVVLDEDHFLLSPEGFLEFSGSIAVDADSLSFLYQKRNGEGFDPLTAPQQEIDAIIQSMENIISL